MEVEEPVVEHVLGHVACPDQLGKQLAGEGEIAAIHRAHQVLTRDRHVLRVRCRGNSDTCRCRRRSSRMSQEHLQRARLVDQFAEVSRFCSQSGTEFARKTDAGLVLGLATVKLLCAITPSLEGWGMT